MGFHKVSIGGSYSGETGELFKSLGHDGVLQFANIGREFTLQVKSEDLDDVIKSLNDLGVDNVNILEWRKFGTTISGSGTSADSADTVNVSLIPSALGSGLRPLSVSQKVEVDRKTYIEMLANIEVVLVDAGVSDALYALQIDKQATSPKYMAAVREASLNALFNSGGVVGVD